jgi:hypothetical protein
MTTDAGAAGGADGLALKSLSGLLSEAAVRLDALRASIHLELRSAYWFGPVADEVRASWETAVGPAIGDNAERLRTLSERVLAGGT